MRKIWHVFVDGQWITCDTGLGRLKKRLRIQKAELVPILESMGKRWGRVKFVKGEK